MRENIKFTTLDMKSSKSHKPTKSSLFRAQVLLFVITFLANASIHVIRVSWSILKPEIRDACSWDISTLGFIDSLFLMSYAVGLILNGQLGDKYARKTVIFFGLLLTAISAISVLIYFH